MADDGSLPSFTDSGAMQDACRLPLHASRIAGLRNGILRREFAARLALDGRLPINPSGGLKSFGHPIGASGVRMITECVVQLRGEAGKRQVKDPELGLAHNVGGPGAVACVIVLGRS